jgi:hypothetical protein
VRAPCNLTYVVEIQRILNEGDAPLSAPKACLKAAVVHRWTLTSTVRYSRCVEKVVPWWSYSMHFPLLF